MATLQPPLRNRLGEEVLLHLHVDPAPPAAGQASEEHCCGGHVSIPNFAAEVHMLRWAILFLILGLIAGVFGFTTIAGASIAIAKLLFFLFVAIFLIFLILGLTAARRL